MLGFVIQRLLQALVVMLAISILVFVGVYAIGNPIDVLISPDADQRIRALAIQQYGLDLPLWQQYLRFLGRLLAGDFGKSFVYNMPVLELIFSRLPATLELTLAAVIGATLIGVPLGMYAGYRPGSALANGIMALSIIGFSVPAFWVGLVRILTFAVTLGWLPAGGRGATVTLLGVEWSFLTLNGWAHLFLPALNLALFKFAMMVRLARAGTREVMLTDTVRFARAAGESEWTILSRHVLRLIAIPLVTVFGLELSSTLAFAVVTETIFSWPGIGKLIIDSISSLDRPVMVAYLMLVAFLFIMINFAVDIAYATLDPRMRVRRAVMDSPLARIWREFRENRIAVAALGVVVVIALLALLAPLIAPQDPYNLASLVLMDARRPPGYVGSGGTVHWLGTDAQGRDLLSAILYGLRISIQIGVAAGAVALVLGATLGASAAYFGGRTEPLHHAHRRLQLPFPAILLALVLSALLGKGMLQLVAALVTAQYAFACTAHGRVGRALQEYVRPRSTRPPAPSCSATSCRTACRR